MLKKQFKKSDIQRVRNIVRKDYTSGVKSQTGYVKTYTERKEGDVWEENGKTWTIEDGVRMNITKLQKFRDYVKIPLKCPKCGGSMQHHLAQKMYKIHGFCFDCTVEYEAHLRKIGMYEAYEKSIMQGNMKDFKKNLQQWVDDFIETDHTYVTEDGTVELWESDKESVKDQLYTNTKKYIEDLDKHLKS